jgi:hypothetical protein
MQLIHYRELSNNVKLKATSSEGDTVWVSIPPYYLKQLKKMLKSVEVHKEITAMAEALEARGKV